MGIPSLVSSCGSYLAKGDRPARLLTFCVLMVTSVTSSFLAVFFKEDLHFTATHIGLLFSIQAVTGVLVAFPAGLSNDRITSRTLVGASLAAQALCFVLMAVVKPFLAFALVFFGWTAANALFRLSLDVQILKSTGHGETSRRVNLYQASRFLGLLLGTLAAGLAIERLDFPLAFLITAGLTFLMLPLVWSLKPTPISAVSLKDYKADFSDLKVVAFALWIFLFTTHWGAEMTCYGLFLREDLGLSFTGLGLYFAGEFLAMVLTFLVMSRTPPTNETLRRLAVWGLFLSGIGHMGQVLRPVWVSFSFRAVHGVGDAMMFVVFYVGISRLFKLERMGGNTGLMNMTTMVGLVAGSLVYSLLGERYGYGLPLWVSGAVTLILIPPLFLRRVRESL